jgi:CRISPR-associated protein Csd2
LANSIQVRYDFALLFDVTDGNPNGDPEAGNLPRFDPETGIGLVTDVCLKRKIRNFVSLAFPDEPAFDIYIKERAILNDLHREAYRELGLLDELKELSDFEKMDRAQRWMCERFYDVRAFGAVMSTGQYRCGQVKGPVQLTFARSIDQVIPVEHTLTRIAVTSEKEVHRQGAEARSMGRKYTVPYGLYRANGFISAPLAKKVGFTEDDLELLWQALINMFEHDRSASRGLMTTRALYVFQHSSALGSAPAHQLLERIRVQKRDPATVARKFDDYEVYVDDLELPKGVSLIRKT